jgi:tRNA dimethylallyltransferase
MASGRTVAELAAEFATQPAPFADWQVVLTRLERAPDDLDVRIHRRVTDMLAAGLVEEVRRLKAEGLAGNPSAAKAIGYREVLSMLDGESRPQSLASTIARNTRALVKKQHTWFRTRSSRDARVIEAGSLREPGELVACRACGAARPSRGEKHEVGADDKRHEERGPAG